MICNKLLSKAHLQTKLKITLKFVHFAVYTAYTNTKKEAVDRYSDFILTLLFADDQLLIQNNKTNLQQFTYKLEQCCNKLFEAKLWPLW